MSNSVKIALLFGFSAFCWKIGYGLSDWALLALLPLTLLLFIANYRIALATRQAWIAVILQRDSWLFRLVRGRFYASFTSAVFVAFTITVIAWKAVSLPGQKLAILVLLFFIATLIAAAFRRWFTSYLVDPFQRRGAIRCATAITGVLFFLLFWRMAYAVDVHDGAILNADFLGALQIGMDRLPMRRGPVAELLAFPFAYDAGKLWLVAELANYDWLRWTSILFSLDEALFSFVLARTAAVLGDALDSGTGKAGSKRVAGGRDA